MKKLMLVAVVAAMVMFVSSCGKENKTVDPAPIEVTSDSTATEETPADSANVETETPAEEAEAEPAADVK